MPSMTVSAPGSGRRSRGCRGMPRRTRGALVERATGIEPAGPAWKSGRAATHAHAPGRSPGNGQEIPSQRHRIDQLEESTAESRQRQSPGQSSRQCRQCRTSGMRRSIWGFFTSPYTPLEPIPDADATFALLQRCAGDRDRPAGRACPDQLLAGARVPGHHPRQVLAAAVPAHRNDPPAAT